MKRIFPSRNSATASSSAPTRTEGYVPPRFAASKASLKQGKRSSSSASKCLAYLRPAQLTYQPRPLRIQAFWIAQRVLNRQVHTRQAGLHLDRAINIFNHRVYNTLRVNHYLDAFIRHIKKPVGLDNL